MTANREPTSEELNGVKQDTVHWPGKAYRVTNVDSDGNELNFSTVINADDDTDLDGVNGLVVNSVLYGRIDAETIKPLRIDGSTHAIKTIEYEHAEIHSGNSFSCWYLQDVSDIGDKTIIAFKTPNTTRYIHIIFGALATIAAHARILEAPTITDNTGASLTVYNRRRVGTPLATTVIDTSQNPDVAGQAMYFTEVTMGEVSGGTELAHQHLEVGEGKKAIGGDQRGSNEWILKPNTLYAFEIESITDDDNTHIVVLDWYEHTDKD